MVKYVSLHGVVESWYENHANWMSCPQSTFKNCEFPSTQSFATAGLSVADAGGRFVSCAVVKARRSAPARHFATFNFSRAVLCHLYFSRGELRSSMREEKRSKGVIKQQIMSKKGYEKTTIRRWLKKGHQIVSKKCYVWRRISPRPLECYFEHWSCVVFIVNVCCLLLQMSARRLNSNVSMWWVYLSSSLETSSDLVLASSTSV